MYYIACQPFGFWNPTPLRMITAALPVYELTGECKECGFLTLLLSGYNGFQPSWSATMPPVKFVYLTACMPAFSILATNSS